MFSLCGRMKKKRKCSWRNARERTTMDETCGTPDDQLILGHKDACTSRLVLNLRASQARAMRSALVKRLYCAVCAVFLGVLSTLPVDFLKFFPRNRNTTTYQMMWNTMSSNSLAIAKSATAMFQMKTLPTGFTVALCSTAIQSCDRHGHRSFLFLRIADFVVDAVDVVDVSVSEIVAFPPSERLAFFWHCFNATNSDRCRRVIWGPPAFKRRTQCLAFCNNSAFRSCIVVSFKSDAIEKHDFLFANIVLRQ